MEAETTEAFNAEAAKMLPPLDECCKGCMGWGCVATVRGMDKCLLCDGDGLDHYARRTREKGISHRETS